MGASASVAANSGNEPPASPFLKLSRKLGLTKAEEEYVAPPPNAYLSVHRSASEKQFDAEVQRELRRVKQVEKDKEVEQNRAKSRMVDPNSVQRVQADGTSIARERDGNSISRLAGRHLKTNLTKNVERERDGSSISRIRPTYSDETFENQGSTSASRISAAAHNPGMHVNTFGAALGPIIEAPDLQTPGTPQAGHGFEKASKDSLAGSSGRESAKESDKFDSTTKASTLRKKKPGLGLSIATNTERDYSNIPSDMCVFMASQSNVIEKSSRRVPVKKPSLTLDPVSVRQSVADAVGGGGGGGLDFNLEMDPTSRRIAGYGAGENYDTVRQARINAEKQSDTTVRVGDFNIRASGISLADENSRRISGTASRTAQKNVNTMLVVLGGSFNFVEIGALGAGASGTVVEALHIPTLTIVALKMLPCYNQAKRASIESELAVLYKNMADLRLVDGSLEDEDEPENPNMASVVSKTGMQKKKKQSPFVLALYDAFTNPKTGLINLVIEYMDGGSLADLVKCGGCSDEVVLSDIASQVLEGLKYLHEHNQMHRDIKPGNILLNCMGRVKVADFGTSKAMDGTAVKFANSFVGTVTYMSPERIVGEAYGFPGDIWSFGVTMFTVAEGEFPFKGDDLGYWGMISAVCDHAVPVPPDPKYTDDFRAFIASSLQKDPAQRGTAAELLKFPFIKPRVETVAFNDGVDVGALVTIDGALVSSSTAANSYVEAQSSPKGQEVLSTLSKITTNRVGGGGGRGSFSGVSGEGNSSAGNAPIASVGSIQSRSSVGFEGATTPLAAITRERSFQQSVSTIDAPVVVMSAAAAPAVANRTMQAVSKVAPSQDMWDEVDPIRYEHLERILDNLHDIVVSAIHAADLMNITAESDVSVSMTQIGFMDSSAASASNTLLSRERSVRITETMNKPMNVDVVQTLHQAAHGVKAVATGLDSPDHKPHTRASGLSPVGSSLARQASIDLSQSNSPPLVVGSTSNDNSGLMSAVVSQSQSDGGSAKYFTSGAPQPPSPTPGGGKSGKAMIKSMLKVAGFEKHSDLLMWRHLANQLYLPYHVVVYTARLHLEEILNELNTE